MLEFQYYESPTERAVSQRFEAKYRITELKAAQILDYIEPYVEADHNAPEGASYAVTSLYLDTPELALFKSSLFGEKNRYKLRIRSYDETEGGLVFLENKRRVDQIIRKRRVTINKTLLPSLLDGQIGTFPHLEFSEKQARNFDEFRYLMDSQKATSKVNVRYDREAYVSNREEPVRITFDRNLTCLPVERYSHAIWGQDAQWFDVPGFAVILEIKFTNAYPAWVQEMIYRFELYRDSFAKYVHCMKMLQKEGYF